MKSIYLIFFTVVVSYATDVFSQEDSLNYNFHFYTREYAIFSVYNGNDTSTIVGRYRELEDTIYFDELRDTIAHLGRFSGSNVTNTGKGVRPPLYARENTIAVWFHYLGGSGNTVHFNDFKYSLIGEEELVVRSYSNLDATDTLHYQDYSPIKFDKFTFVDNFYSDTISLSTSFGGGILSRKRRKKKNNHLADFWLLNFNVFYSKNQLNIDIKNVVGNELYIGNRKYTVIYE